MARPSFEKLNYALRPAKQVERKLFIEALHTLSGLGYSIRDYTYFGLGSVYFADFVLFHKYLYLDSMICAEKSNKPNRMQFNKPFDFIRLEMKAAGEIKPDPEIPHLVWLDYDGTLDADVLADAYTHLTQLKQASIFIVTVSAQPSIEVEAEDEPLDEDGRIARRVGRMRAELGGFFDGDIAAKHFNRRDLPLVYAEVLRTHFSETVAGRRVGGLEFLQLFNMIYADGVQMLTIGGILETPENVQSLRESRLFDLEQVHEDLVPTEVLVPPLTAKEITYLNSVISTVATAEELPFEIRQDMLDSYRRFYRHYPNYNETIV